MPRRWFTGGVLSVTGLTLAAILFVSLNLWAGAALTGARLDLTQEGLFTLSPGTRNILKSIDEPITFRFYFSERLGRDIPSYAIYANRVRDMLHEFAAAAGGRLRLEVIEPEPFSDIEDRAVALGLQGVPIDRFGEQVYFGLAGTNSTDDVEVIPFFQGERGRFLEYDLARLAYILANPRRPVIGVASSLPLNGNIRAAMAGLGRVGEPWIVMRQLRQLFEVRQLGPDPKQIDDDIDVLMLVHPTGLSGESLYAIDQYLMGGGRALIFVDPYAEGLTTRPPMGPPKPAASDLEPLFDAWGLELVDGKVAGDLRFARQVDVGTGRRVEPARYVAWLALDGTTLDRDDPVVSDIRALNLASVGFLRRAEDAAVTLTPLITTSPEAMVIDAEKLSGLPDVKGLLGAYRPGGERLVLAARLGGIVNTAFPDGPPKAEDAETANEAADPTAEQAGPAADQLLQSATPLNVIVVADTDLLEDRFWVGEGDFFGQRMVLPVAGNGDLVINAIDNLAGSSDLISLRSRGTVSRPFVRLEGMQRAAEQRLRGKEQELQERLQATRKKLAELETTEPAAGAAILSDEQRQAIQDFRLQLLDIRGQLRAVQRDLRRDIEALEGALRFANIGLVPI
ncbi:MAG: Gldg family protein, partial [Kiloniellales bacterium]